MASTEATRELLSPRDDVWAFLAEPHHLSDWWPGVAGVQPDRRGLAPGARWRLALGERPGLLRGARASTTLVVERVEKPALAAWHLTGERIHVEVRLEPSGNRTHASIRVTGPWLVGLRRALPRRALERLHALCQTAAGL